MKLASLPHEAGFVDPCSQLHKFSVRHTNISIVKYNEEDYISLTDMAKSQLQEL